MDESQVLEYTDVPTCLLGSSDQQLTSWCNFTKNIFSAKLYGTTGTHTFQYGMACQYSVAFHARLHLEGQAK